MFLLRMLAAGLALGLLSACAGGTATTMSSDPMTADNNTLSDEMSGPDTLAGGGAGDSTGTAM